jgi:hypothetical protein
MVPLAGLPGRDEAGEDRVLRLSRGDGNDIRQDALKPWHFPVSALGEHPLHIDAEVNRAGARRAVP